MTLRACLTGCTVGYANNLRGSRFQALMTLCIDVCIDLYVLVGTAVSFTGAWPWDFEVLR